MVKVYCLHADKSTKKLLEFFRENNIHHTVQRVGQEPVTWEQLVEILMNTELGVEDILSDKSNDYKVLVAEGVDFEKITLTELQQFVEKRPRVLKLPICIHNRKLLVGFNEEEVTKFKNKKAKRKELEALLS